MKLRTGGLAFPSADQGLLADYQLNTVMRQELMQGMTLRDYFAAQALQGQMQREKDFGKTVREQGFSKYAAHIAETSYQLADAMLAARSA